MKRTWQRWTDEQDQLVREIWAGDRPIRESVGLFPVPRSTSSIVERAKGLGLGRRSPAVHRVAEPTDRSIKAALQVRPMDSVELAAKVDMSRRAVMARLKYMHENKEVHIARWERFAKAGYAAKVWALGPGRDAAKPTPMSNTEKARLRMRRLRLDHPDEYCRVIARKKHLDAIRNNRWIKRDPLVAAFFGSGAA